MCVLSFVNCLKNTESVSTGDLKLHDMLHIILILPIIFLHMRSRLRVSSLLVFLSRSFSLADWENNKERIIRVHLLWLDITCDTTSLHFFFWWQHFELVTLKVPESAQKWTETAWTRGARTQQSKIILTTVAMQLSGASDSSDSVGFPNVLLFLLSIMVLHYNSI